MLTSLPGKKTRILINLIIIALGCIAAAVTFYLEHNARQSIANALINRNLEKVTLELRNFFIPVRQSLLVSKKWAQNSNIPEIKQNNVKALNTKFTTLMELEDFGAVSAVIAANSSGKEYLLRAKEQNWQVELANMPQTGKMTTQLWDDANTLLSSTVTDSDYSPLNRPWYKNAQHYEGFSWTAPYVFASTSTPGITASLKVKNSENSQKDLVLACDIELKDFRKFINTFKITPFASSFIIDSNETLLAANTLGSKQPDELKTLRASIAPANRHIIDQYNKWRKTRTTENFSYMSKGKLWWCGIEEIKIDNMLLYVGIVIPETDFLSEIDKRHNLHLLIIVAIILTTATIFILLNTIFRLMLKQKHFANLASKDLIEQGESTTVEFKSTLRMNLRTQKSGKEIELAWVKAIIAFLNTRGGTLFIGVADDGTIHGLESDGFANEDKLLLHFNNIVNTHLGLEYSKFINVKLETISNKRIVRVTCSKADRPAFLKQGDNEEFYIRSGPSSRKLTTSKALNYIKEKKL